MPDLRTLHERQGPLTADLVQEPGKFGLGRVPSRLLPDATTTVVCGFCSTGCGLKAHLKEGEAINLSAETGYPVNLGMACPKGWEALTPLEAPDRATAPLLKNAEGVLERVSWDRALKVFCERFKKIQAQHGKESVAFISTGQIVTEEMAFLGALAKFGMGMIHGDGNTRQCMATAATAYKQSFGFDSPPFTYADFEESDVIVLWGSNLCVAHPIMWQRVLRNPHAPEIIVVDPRTTETAMNATQHYALQPKSDLVLLYGLARLLVKGGWVKPEYVGAHTSGYLDFEKFVEKFTPGLVAAQTGIPEKRLEHFARTIGQGKRVSFWWTMGVNQGHEATRTAQAIINLALMTGNIGRPGTGANSITGQCNAMGSRLFSNTTNLMGGHDFKNPQHRAKVAGELGIPVRAIPDRDSWAYDQILEGIDSGKIRGLWIIATNTAHSWIHQGRAAERLQKLDFLVVQDMYHTTETARGADVILPAGGWGEKEGTFINSERRIGLSKKIRRAPGEALADFSIFRLVAEYWGCGAMFREWESPEAVFQILKRVSSGQPCDISGIRDYRMIDEQGGIQWPCPSGMKTVGQERRLFEEGRFFHADGLARFLFEAPTPVDEPVDRDYPFVLLTGRGSSAQWHTLTRTGKSPVLQSLSPSEVYVEIHPADARSLALGPGQWVEVRSRRGTLRARSVITPIVRPGQVFVPMHFAKTNLLTYPKVDPYSRQPSYKHCAVRVEPVGPPPFGPGGGVTPEPQVHAGSDAAGDSGC
ncbi:MAG: nitrate reductase [Verrucomicrobiae bacterium]|nr:nitrate reductase [Verrucomicrobiae bacterium]